MFLKKRSETSAGTALTKIEQMKTALQDCDAIVIGAGAGQSASAGFTYTGERIETCFFDFTERYGIRDMYSGGFYSFATPEELEPVYLGQPKLGCAEARVRGFTDAKAKDYFAITTNVDHCFQKAGFDKKRLLPVCPHCGKSLTMNFRSDNKLVEDEEWPHIKLSFGWKQRRSERSCENDIPAADGLTAES